MHALICTETGEVVALVDCINGPQLRGFSETYQPGDIVKAAPYSINGIQQYQPYYRIVKSSNVRTAVAMLDRYRAELSAHSEKRERIDDPLRLGLNWYEVGGE